MFHVRVRFDRRRRSEAASAGETSSIKGEVHGYGKVLALKRLRFRL